MRARLLTAAAIAAVIGSLGGLAIAAASQVSTTPAPVPVGQLPLADDTGADDAPTTTRSDDRRGRTPSDTTPEAGDDKGGLRPEGVSDDPADHDAGDDKGGLRPDGVSDDPADHDAGDDKGGLRPEGVSDDGPGDDSSGGSGSSGGSDDDDDSSGSSGSGSSGSSDDDSSDDDSADDSGGQGRGRGRGGDD